MAKYFLNHLLTVFFILLSGSCISNKFHTVSLVNDPLITGNYIKVLNNQYPDSFSITQRIILNVAGKQYDFIGQLTMNRGTAYRAVAFGEMGGQFIDLLATKDSIIILSNPTDLPKKPIVHGVAEDIKQLFYYDTVTDLNFSDLANSTVKISINLSDNDQLIYMINKYNNQILNLHVYSGTKQIGSTEFLEYKKYDSWEHEIPSYIKLTNYRWQYSLEIRLLKFSNQYNADKVFNLN
jgi:hypothetical protein